MSNRAIMETDFLKEESPDQPVWQRFICHKFIFKTDESVWKQSTYFRVCSRRVC